VLLLGESGTGKGAAAESIHQKSDRADGPFVIVDCGAIPRTLLPSELFGHEAGAFTGADRARIGAFESAAGGTLFLDEIGELPLELQPQLLRAIDSRTIKRLGSNERRDLDVRLIAATNRELETEVNARRFRADLYYRIAVITARLPPLRLRTSDIPMLVERILADLGDTRSPMARDLASGDLLPELFRHAWPGNIRELRNYIEACIARQESALEVEDHQQPTIDTRQPLRTIRDRWVRYAERRYLEQLLAEHDDNVSAAARSAGVARVHLHRLLRRAGLR
jgi:transcriptional regulator with PAS, ATPase and Fis domain